MFRQILNEVLRLTILGTFGARYSDDDIVIGGYLIPAGTPIMTALGVSLKNETVWKNPEKLDLNLKCDQACKKFTMQVRVCTVVNMYLCIYISIIHLQSLKNSK